MALSPVSAQLVVRRTFLDIDVREDLEEVVVQRRGRAYTDTDIGCWSDECGRNVRAESDCSTPTFPSSGSDTPTSSQCSGTQTPIDVDEDVRSAASSSGAPWADEEDDVPSPRSRSDSWDSDGSVECIECSDSEEEDSSIAQQTVPQRQFVPPVIALPIAYPVMPMQMPMRQPCVTPEMSLEAKAAALTAVAERFRREAREARAAAASSKIETSGVSQQECTTLMLRDLPRGITRKALADVLNADFSGQYDFIYLPLDFQRSSPLGYAFVNFISNEAALSAMAHFQGFTQWTPQNETPCIAVWSAPHQGLEAHIERYRNSPVMHPAVPDKFKPLLLQDGQRLSFPAPTKKLTAPFIPKAKRHTGRQRSRRSTSSQKQESE